MNKEELKEMKPLLEHFYLEGGLSIKGVSEIFRVSPILTVENEDE